MSFQSPELSGKGGQIWSRGPKRTQPRVVSF
ncbi:hypothetical protein IQ22_03598 [Pseudomonas duriflava]|uniref:Uncharacterized protein n=1 Tax=Pseudomonas duriflava TaxID=459528 RepID=A0A562Q6U9_9PSED|nr:hypothetical protein IQ22_03598 [Pseudomonas duriflava]